MWLTNQIGNWNNVFTTVYKQEFKIVDLISIFIMLDSVYLYSTINRRYSVSQNCWLGVEFWSWNVDDEEDKGELLPKLLGPLKHGNGDELWFVLVMMLSIN